jgi:hypothetical protein
MAAQVTTAVRARANRRFISAIDNFTPGMR